MSDDELLADALALADRLDGRDGRVVRGLVARWERAKQERSTLYGTLRIVGETADRRPGMADVAEAIRGTLDIMDAPGGPAAQRAEGGE